MDLLLHRDFRTAKYDLVFVNGECPTTAGYVDAVVQRLHIRLKTLYQEWFINTEYGVPWLEKILGHKVSKTTVDMIIQENILKEQGVSQIVSFESSFDGPSRMYSCRFSVRADNGQESGTIII